MSSATIPIGVSFAPTSSTRVTPSVSQITRTLTGTKYFHDRRSIATSEVDLDFSSLTPKFAVIVNHDATNYVEVGIATTVYSTKLAAGDCCILCLHSTSTHLFCKANTAACEIEVLIIPA